jgi:arsenical pump membrane protein
LISAALLALVLTVAVLRPFGGSEACVSLPAALVVMAVGAVSWTDARNELSELAPVVGFLAAVLLLSQMCSAEGLFDWCGMWIARAAKGRSDRLLFGVFVAASLMGFIETDVGAMKCERPTR